MNVYPEWWPRRKNGANSPSTYILRPEHVGLFAKLKKGDSYNLEYIIEIPNSNENYFYFNLFYQDYSMPYVEVHKKYRKLNESFFPLLITKSNIIKVSCRRISDYKEDGYTCEFRE